MFYRLSNDANNLQGQPMFKVLAKVQELERKWENIIHFEIWDPDFSTPDNIINAAIKSLEEWKTHYTNSYWLREFREMIIWITKKSRWFEPELNQILISPWANILIYYAVKCCVNIWDDVIVPDPWFPTYYSVCNFCWVNAIRVPLREKYDFKIQLSDIKNKITKNTRLIILNSPSNPTWAVLSKHELKEIAEFAIENKIYLYSDEIYSRMVFDDTEFFSPGFVDKCKEYIIVANGFSKAFAMTGWRLWVAIWPEDVIEKMSLLLQTTSSCVPAFIQEAWIEAIKWEQSKVNFMMKEYQERRDILVAWLNNIKWITCNLPHWAFYIFPNIKETWMTSEEFADFALEKAKVSLLPWSNFWEYWEWFVRLCYANSKENILEWIRRLSEVLGTK